MEYLGDVIQLDTDVHPQHEQEKENVNDQIRPPFSDDQLALEFDFDQMNYDKGDGTDNRDYHLQEDEIDERFIREIVLVFHGHDED